MADDDRPLTPDGEKRMVEVGRGLRELEIELDRIVSSPLPRALRTAEIVADELGAKKLLETSDALRADRGAASIRDWLRGRSEARLMIVGHNPSFSELLGLLLTGEPTVALCELKKGGIAALRSADEGAMTLDWVVKPKFFRKLVR